MENNKYIICPLIDDKIENIDCIVFGDLGEQSMPDKFKQKENWRDICRNCRYHNY